MALNFEKLLTIFRRYIVYDEKSAVLFLQERRSIHRELQCENGHNMKLQVGGEIRWRCHVKGCNKTKGVRMNTWLSGTTLPLETIVHFLYCWSQEMTSPRFYNEELNMSKTSVIEWKNYLRDICVKKMESYTNSIGGAGQIIEMYERLYATKRNNTGKLLSQQWILGCICPETKDCFLVRIPDRSRLTIYKIIEKYIEPGSVIVTNRWKDYKSVYKNGFQYKNNQYSFVDPMTQSTRTWSEFQSYNKKLGKEMAEFMWRMKLKGRHPFDAILEDIVLFHSIV